MSDSGTGHADRLRRLTPHFGVGAMVLTFGTMGLAIAVSPSFWWTRNALSNLGDAGDPAGTALTVLLFNGGLIVGGLAGLVFAIGLALADTHPIRRLGAGAFALSMLAMAGVGVFPQDGPFHVEAAVSFYLLFSVAAMVYGTGQVLDGERREGLASVLLSTANLGIWVGWLTNGGLTRPGLAIPEIAGAALVAVWTVVQVRRLWTAS